MKSLSKIFRPGKVFCAMLFASCLINTVSIFAQGAAINETGASPDPSALLDVSSSTHGFLLPRMTTDDRNAIVSPAQGLQIFNTTTNCFEFYLGTLWQTMVCGCISAPASPTEGSHTSSTTETEWKWSAVSGATGYKFHTVNDFSTASDNGAGTGYTQTNLTCATLNTLYVWAYNSCGNSPVVVLTASTSACPFVCGTSSVSFTYNGSSVTYGTVLGGYSAGVYCWLDRNLGASAVATAYDDASGFGDLFQWGRLDDAHQLRSPVSGTTTSQSGNPNPGHPNFIKGWSNWYNGSNPDALWQGVTGTNNPCPTGWRIPTETELNNERISWSGNNASAAFNGPLKLTAAGYRNDNGNAPTFQGASGFYWTSNVSSALARYLTYNSSSASMVSDHRAGGMSVRCIRNY